MEKKEIFQKEKKRIVKLMSYFLLVMLVSAIFTAAMNSELSQKVMFQLHGRFFMCMHPAITAQLDDYSFSFTITDESQLPLIKKELLPQLLIPSQVPEGYEFESMDGTEYIEYGQWRANLRYKWTDKKIHVIEAGLDGGGLNIQDYAVNSKYVSDDFYVGDDITSEGKCVIFIGEKTYCVLVGDLPAKELLLFIMETLEHVGIPYDAPEVGKDLSFEKI